MKINTLMLIETMKALTIGESMGKILNGKDIEAIKEAYGAYGFSIENWLETKNQKVTKKHNSKNGAKEELDSEIKIHLGDKTQLTMFALNGLLNCIKDDCIIYNQKKISEALINWYGLQTNGDVKTYDFNEYLIYNYKNILCQINTDIVTINNIKETIVLRKPYDLSNQVKSENGLYALTRTIPFAFFAKSDLEAWVYGAQQSTLTHGGSTWKCCAILSLFLFKILKEHKRIKTAWKNIKGDKDTFERYYRSVIDIEKIMTSTINVASNFKGTEEIIEKLKFTLKKIKSGNEYKDIYIDYDLHEQFGEENTIENILCTGLYIACVSKGFDIAMEVSLNNNYDKEVLASIVAAIFVVYHKGATIDYLFNEIEEHQEIEDFLYEVKKQISDTNFRMLTQNDVTKEELLTFVQMKDFEKTFEKEKPPTSFMDKFKNIFLRK